MRRLLKRKNLFPGWRMVLYCTLLLGVTHGLCNNCYSLFVIPLTTDLGISRQSYSAVQTIVNLIFMGVSLLSGRIYRKVPVMTTMRIAAVVLPVAYGCCALCHSIVTLYLCAALYGLALGFLTFLPVTNILSAWFEESRGLAIGVAFMGTGLGGMIFAALGGQWIQAFGWRWTFGVYAVIIAVVVLPIVFLLLKPTPAVMGLQPLRGKNGQSVPPLYGPEAKDAMRSRAMAVQLFIALVIGLVTSVLAGTMVPHLTDLGFGASYASALYSAYLGLMAFTKVLLGTLSDRLGAKKATALSLAGCAVSCLCLVLGLNQLLHLPLVLTIALGCASSTVLYPLLTRYSFGSRAYAELYGVITAANSLSSSACYLFQNAVYDSTGSYNLAYIISIGLTVLALLAIPLLKETRPDKEDL